MGRWSVSIRAEGDRPMTLEEIGSLLGITNVVVAVVGLVLLRGHVVRCRTIGALAGVARCGPVGCLSRQR